MQILIVDDHPLFLDGLTASLSRGGCFSQIHTADSVQMAIVLLEQYPNLDMILLDLGLPGVDGLSFLKFLNQQPLIIPVIVISSSNDMSEIRQALEMGVMGFIPKSYDSQQIISVIDDVLEGQVSIPQIIKTSLDEHGEQQLQSLASTKLRKKQLRVLELMAQGLNNTEIADELCITYHTVKNHVSIILRALNCANRVEVVMEARRLGLVV